MKLKHDLSGTETPTGQEETAILLEEQAHLIAAAPDMLEALEGAKWAMESGICTQLLKKMDVYQDVVKAIRKARSEE